jgi:small subunit ribosomal protein S2
VQHHPSHFYPRPEADRILLESQISGPGERDGRYATESKEKCMPEAGLKELLEAGVHFGHQTRRWNPNMRRFIFGELDGIHIIDLLQTEALLENARRFTGELASGGGTILFVGTKKQARDVVQEWAERCKMPYVNKRWLGGLLTNFQTMSGRIARLHELNGWKEEGKLDLLPTKERMGMEAELAKLEFNLGGVRDMDRLPDAVFVTDLKTEEIAVHEAARLRIPIIGLVDTNCDPTPVDYVIPGNDDAIRSCQLIIGTIGGAVEEGSSAWRVQEEKRIAEEMERRKRDEEERRKREEEEKARLQAQQAKEAEEEAAKQAAAKAEAEKQKAAVEAAAKAAPAKPAEAPQAAPAQPAAPAQAPKAVSAPAAAQAAQAPKAAAPEAPAQEALKAAPAAEAPKAEAPAEPAAEANAPAAESTESNDTEKGDS